MQLNKKPIYILGVGGLAHDASACLMKDGEIIAACNEERFTRVKNQGGMPEKTINWCLDFAKIKIEDIDYVGFYYTWKQLLGLMFGHLKYFFTAPRFVRTKIYRLLTKLFDTMYLTHGKFKNFKPKRFIKVHHDLAHASSAYFNSSFDEAAIISIDLGNIAIYRGQGNKIELLKRMGYPPIRIGMFYTLATQYLGFYGGTDEYKVMGLSAYGKPDLYEKLKDILILKKDDVRLDLSYFESPLGKTGFSEKFRKIVGEQRQPNEKVEQRHSDLAYAVQRIFEDAMFYLTDMAYELTKSENLCLSGGSALNCLANGKLLTSSKFKNVFVPPGVADAGISEGIVYYVWNHLLENPKKRINISDYDPYLGPEYSNDEIKSEIEKCKLKSEFLSDNQLFKRTAELIAKGQIVGWFQGRTEWGARALGNRSILADATVGEMKDIVNKAIKYREEFRPFAPSVLEESAVDYFDGIKEASPFMSIIFKVKEDKQKILPAITHVDGTARPQTVNKKLNPRYWNLIKEFENIKGVPVILNTSFNVKGEPIINSPKDAIRCFYSTGLDYLVMGNYLISK